VYIFLWKRAAGSHPHYGKSPFAFINYYNLRSQEVSYTVGQEIYWRFFQQGKFVKGFTAKLAAPFVKARIRGMLGTAYYELEDLQGKLVGKYHAKNIEQ